MTIQAKHETGGRPITIWVEQAKLAGIDAVCESAHCSRSWLFAQMLAFYNFHELASEPNK